MFSAIRCACFRKRKIRPSDDAPLAPGMLNSHYAPRAAMRLNATDSAPAKRCSRSGRPCRSAEACKILNLSERGDLVEAAANLFSHLRTLDASGAKPSRHADTA